MDETNIDINILIQTFSDKVNQLSNDLIVKDAIIRQLMNRIDELEKKLDLDK